MGVHFSTHQYWDNQPDDKEIVKRVRSHRRDIEEVGIDTVRIVSFHNPPDWLFRRSFGGFTSTYELRFFDDV